MNAFETRSLHIYYKSVQALCDVSVKISSNKITAVIGPSGSGKTTLLRTFNRLLELNHDIRLEGEVYYKGQNIYTSGVEVNDIRRKIGMVFQKPLPFPGTVRENLLWASKINRLSYNPDELIEQSLIRVHMWDELKDKLSRSALELSAGQQQRLCIARALSISPEVLLLDEPTSTLDPIASGRVEDLIYELKDTCTIVLVTNNLQQAGRISDDTAFLLNGFLIEKNETRDLFYNPGDQRTENFLSGRIGSETDDCTFGNRISGLNNRLCSNSAELYNQGGLRNDTTTYWTP